MALTAAAGGPVTRTACTNALRRPRPVRVRSSGPFPTAPPLRLDHSLSLALQRMGASGLNVLPVVSRANLRQLMGIVALSDVLDAYGVATRGGDPERSE